MLKGEPDDPAKIKLKSASRLAESRNESTKVVKATFDQDQSFHEGE